MILGTDQGTTISLDRGTTWSTWYNQPTAQLYHVTTDNQFPYVVYGAQQDSGAAAVLSRTDHGQITPRDWFPAGPSESGYIVVDPKDPDIIYLSDTYGGAQRFNKRTSLSQDISPWPAVTWDADVHERKYRGPWSPVLVLSSADQTALYLGTQYVMKTVDGGLHWETISPDLTGANRKAISVRAADDGKPAPARASAPASAPTLEDAERDGYGVVFTIAPSPLNKDLIWAGSDTGLIHLTRDGGKKWNDVTPPGLSAWSRISLIEASHYDPAVAYAAVDRSRLDDFKPYIYRTRDYGTTWQLINDGIGASAFLRAVREDPQNKGLLFAGTEFGVYVSFDDGDHWQSLQLNLPTTSVRDLTIHGDDLVIATHGRSFWILDDIAPLRQMADARGAGGEWRNPHLYKPATAVRVDNDFFTGTPLPPEEPTAENPPNGAMIDYFLPSSAGSVTLEIFDAQQNLVRRFSADDGSDGTSKTRKKEKHPLPVAERWLPKPEVLDKNAGMHRSVWNLIWGSSGGADADEESEYRNPRGPKAVPGTYEVRLTVNGKVQSQSLKVVMDPRSPATAEVLAQQFQLGQQIFGEAVEARRVLTEIGLVQEQLADRQHKIEQLTGPQQLQLKSALEETQSAIGKIMRGKEHSPGESSGLQDAYRGLASTLRVVEGGDRAAPSQAIQVYQETSTQVKARTAEWTELKKVRLDELNRELHEAHFAPIESGH